MNQDSPKLSPLNLRRPESLPGGNRSQARSPSSPRRTSSRVSLLEALGLVITLCAAACGPSAQNYPEDLQACTPESFAGRAESGSWDPGFTLDGFTGMDGLTPAVRAFARDLNGDLLVAGYFTWLGREPVGPVARLTTTGSWEPARANIPTGSVSAIAVDPSGRLALSSFAALPPVPNPTQSGTLYMETTGGSFQEIGHFDGAVREIAWVGDTLWVAGRFTLGESGPSDLAVWDGETWSPPPGGPVDGPVYELVVEGTKVLVGGAFKNVGGVAADSVAEWDGTSWHAYGMGDFDGGNGGEPVVFSLVRNDEGELFAGGAFFSGTNYTSSSVARWTADGWQLVGEGVASFDLDFAVVSDMAFYEGELYVTGHVNREGGSVSAPKPFADMARWTGESWEAVPGTQSGFLSTSWIHPWVYGVEPSGTAILEIEHQRLFTHAHRLVVGGQFPGIGHTPSKGMAVFDGRGWQPVYAPETGLGLVGSASELAVGGNGCDVYALGAISHAGDDSGAWIYRFSDGGWSEAAALHPEVPEGTLCDQMAVTPSGELFVGCTRMDLTATPHVITSLVYRREGNEWVSLGEMPQEAIGSIMDLQVDPLGRLWIVGGEVDAGFVVRWDEDHFTLVEHQFDGAVRRIAFKRNVGATEYVVGGGFRRLGAPEVNRIARWDGEKWEALGTGVRTTILALAYGDDALYASTASEEPGHLVLGKWNGATWQELGRPGVDLPPASTHGVQTARYQFYELLARGEYLIAAGSVYAQSGPRHVFVHDGEKFSSLGGGVGAITVDTMAATKDDLWLGGMIATTGDGSTLAPSVGVARFQLGAQD